MEDSMSSRLAGYTRGVILPVLPAAVAAALAQPAPVAVTTGDLAAIRAAVAAPGASAVLVNLWATWCDACRDELPAILQFARAHRADGVRLILVSADDEDQRDQVAAFLSRAGATGVQAFIKHGDDNTFINGMDPKWTGALPASFLYDGRGAKRRFWSGPVTARDLETALAALKKGKP
jgi:thiol-disulfide isomerase/thioredoxin